MPQVRNLINNTARPATADPVAPGVTPEPLTGGVVVPADVSEFKFSDTASPLAVFAGLPGLVEPDGLPDPESGGGGPYASFASSRSPNWLALSAAGIGDGQPYVSADGQFHKANPLKFFLVSCAPCFYTRRNTAGNIVTVARKQIETANRKDELEEHYLTLIVADLGNRLVPCKAEFVGTKSGAVVPAIRTLKQAMTPDWAKLSDAHRVTAAYPTPFGRVVGSASSQSRTSRSSGNAYFAGVGSAGPATIDQMQRLTAAFADPGFQSLAGAAKESFLDRLALLEKLAG